MLSAVFVKDGSDYVKIYSVYLNIFNNHFYFKQLIYSFAATTCKIGAKDNQRLLYYSTERSTYHPSFVLWQSKKLSVNRMRVFLFDSLP